MVLWWKCCDILGSQFAPRAVSDRGQRQESFLHAVLFAHTRRLCRTTPASIRYSFTFQQRALLQHHLVHEHTLLRQSPATEIVSSEDFPGHRISSQTGVTADPCSPQEESLNSVVRHRDTSGNGGGTNQIPAHSGVVEGMFRKARLRHCFTRILQEQQRRDENRDQSSANTSQPTLGLQRQGFERLDALVEATRKELGSAMPPESVEPPQPVEPHPEDVERDIVIDPRVPQRPLPAEDSPPPRGDSDDEAERAQRRILLHRFFQAARRQDIVGGGERLDLGEGGVPAAVGGAPCFTVGGSGGRRSTTSTAQGSDEEGNHANSFGGPGGLRLRRADLLRRILRAMRYCCTSI